MMADNSRSTDSRTAEVIEMDSPLEMVVEPLYLIRPCYDHAGEFAAIVTLGDEHTCVRGLDTDEYEDRPLEFLKGVIKTGGQTLADLILRAYYAKMFVKIGTLRLSFGGWECIFAGYSFHQQVLASRVISFESVPSKKPLQPLR